MESIRFMVATDPTYYGAEAEPQDIQEYADFAEQFLLRNGYEHVEIEFVERYPMGTADDQSDLRDEIWSAFRGT